MSGEANGYVMTAEAIRDAIAEGLFDGLACFADHAMGGARDGRAPAGGPSVRQLVGVWRGVGWQPMTGDGTGAAVGWLVAYETESTRPVLDLLEQWLDEGGEADMGVSIVFYPLLEADGRTVRRIVMVESADLVMFPASPGSRIIGRV
jgi:hypothetical protein